MRKTVKISIIIAGIIIIFTSIYGVYSKINTKRVVTQRINRIPDFTFVSLEGKNFTKDDIQKDKSTILIYFNSECEYCQSEASDIQKSILKFDKSQIIFVSTEPVEIIKSFAIEHGLLRSKNIMFLRDNENQFTNQFGANVIPFVLFYDKQQFLKEKFRGYVNVNKLIRLQ